MLDIVILSILGLILTCMCILFYFIITERKTYRMKLLHENVYSLKKFPSWNAYSQTINFAIL